MLTRYERICFDKALINAAGKPLAEFVCPGHPLLESVTDLVLERRCHRAVFFEDPHVARQHEADIPLLERAVTTATHDAVCVTVPSVAQRWCDAVRLRAAR